MLFLRRNVTNRMSFRRFKKSMFFGNRPSDHDGHPERRYGAKIRCRGISPRMRFALGFALLFGRRAAPSARFLCPFSRQVDHPARVVVPSEDTERSYGGKIRSEDP